MGAELGIFSPIHDAKLPEDLDGLLLSGGYPELNGRQKNWKKISPCATEIRITSYPGRNALYGRMWRIYVSSSGDGGYGRKAAHPMVCGVIPGRALPHTEAEPVRLYHPYGKTGFRTW